MRIFSLLAIVAGAADIQGAQVCEPSSAVLEILVNADQPRDQRISHAERVTAIRTTLEQGLARFPEDPFLHAQVQDLELGKFGENRPSVAERYEKRLAEQPGHAHRRYLAARALYSHRTERGLGILTSLLADEPDYGLARLLLARIRMSKSFLDADAAKAALLAFEKSCPDTPGLFSELAWFSDVPFVTGYMARARERLARHTDLLALRAYPSLWQAEKGIRRSDEMRTTHEAWEADVARIRGSSFQRSESWLRALWEAEFIMDKRLDDLAEGFQKHFPHAWPSIVVSIGEAKKLGATSEAMARFRELGQRYPASPGLGSHWIAAAKSVKDDGRSLVEAYAYMRTAMELDPDQYLTSPPYQIDMATDMVKRRIALEAVPQFVFAGLSAGERMTARETESDLFPAAAKARSRMHDAWYLFAYFPLAEAYALTQKFAEGRDVLSQAQTILERMRPPSSGSPEERARFARFEASFWRVKGLLAEKQGRSLDALVAYRNALESYPPQTAFPDERKEVLDAAQRLAKHLGGTAEGWNDWGSRHPMAGLRAGDGGPNAWRTLAAKKPDLKIMAMNGREYSPEELSKRATFINVWATWCMPCRAELPYLEKLAARFSITDKVVFVALNVDEDVSAVQPFLEQFKFSFRTSLAHDYAYEFLPVFGVPANYVMQPDKTIYFESGKRQDAWVEEAAGVLEKALRDLKE